MAFYQVETMPNAMHICGQRSQLSNACLHSNTCGWHSACPIMALTTNLFNLKANISQKSYYFFCYTLACYLVMFLLRTLHEYHVTTSINKSCAKDQMLGAVRWHFISNHTVVLGLNNLLHYLIQWYASQWSPAGHSVSEVTCGFKHIWECSCSIWYSVFSCGPP